MGSRQTTPLYEMGFRDGASGTARMQDDPEYHNGYDAALIARRNIMSCIGREPTLQDFANAGIRV